MLPFGLHTVFLRPTTNMTAFVLSQDEYRDVSSLTEAKTEL